MSNVIPLRQGLVDDHREPVVKTAHQLSGLSAEDFAELLRRESRFPVTAEQLTGWEARAEETPFVVEETALRIGVQRLVRASREFEFTQRVREVEL
jgi:hypothetical protein